MNIGNWVRRSRVLRKPGALEGFAVGSRQKWHLVDSTIEDRAVTRCGREMHRVTKRGELEVRDTMPLTRTIGQPQLCRQCDGGAR